MITASLPHGARWLTAAAMLALGLLVLPRSAGATSCLDSARGGGARAPACPLAPGAGAPRRVTAPTPLDLLGPRQTDDLAPRVPGFWHGSRSMGRAAVEVRSVRSMVEGDIEERDCYAGLCGPQSATLRVGLLSFERQGTFSPMIGGLGAVAGAIAMNLKPGPRPEAAPGPSLDGWAEAPRGLKPSGPPFAFLPLISINNREGGARFLVSW